MSGPYLAPGRLAENTFGPVARFSTRIESLKAPMRPLHLPKQRSAVAPPVDFFKDSPWLNIPEDRLGEILIEPLHPPGRLLGGTSKQDGKPKSKLALLAEARKRKENQRPDESETTTSSVALLDRLGGKPRESKRVKASHPLNPSSEDQTMEPNTNSQRSKYPVRKAPEASLLAQLPQQAKSEIGSSAPGSTGANELRSAPVAAPSSFALAMFGSTFKTQEMNLHCSLAHSLKPFPNHAESNFTGPSPDDTVLEAQRSKGKSQKPTKQAPQTGKTTTIAKDITEGVGGLSIEGQHVKGKNLDVLEEFKKSKPKNAANFVVIGMPLIMSYRRFFLTRSIQVMSMPVRAHSWAACCMIWAL